MENSRGSVVIMVLVLIGLIYFAIKSRDRGPLWLMVVGGGLNVGEKLIFGYVRDYWRIPFLPVYNNINDWLIFGGALWYLWKYFSKTR
jgi:lipoprotein signal peptidase